MRRFWNWAEYGWVNRNVMRGKGRMEGRGMGDESIYYFRIISPGTGRGESGNKM
jgi:hypothetical protein